MIPYYGDFAEDATVRIVFNTFTSNDPTASATITNLADADIKVHKDGGLTQIVTDGATIIIDFDSITGNHLLTIDTSVHADYSTGSDYFVRIEGTTVDGATINSWVGQFSIENRGVAGAKALLDRVNSKALHNVAGSFGKQIRLLGSIIQVDGSVTGTPTATVFDTTLTDQDGYWDDAVLIFDNGAANAGKGHPVKASLNTDGQMTFDLVDAWAVLPVNGDEFTMLAFHVHPVSQIAEESRIEMDANSIVMNAIKTITDQFAFTVANEVDSNVITKTGFSLAATGLDAIVATATGMVAIAKAIWDRVLTGGTHNVTNSAGRRLRTLLESGNYAQGLVWVDTVDGISGTTPFENGTEVRPVDNIADANTIRSALPLHGFHIAAGSSITLAATQDNQEFAGNGWTLALGGQSISGSHIVGAVISGISTGALEHVDDCELGDCTFAGGEFTMCAITGTQILTGAIEYRYFDCFHGGTPVIDFGAIVGATTVHIHGYSGAITIKNMGQVAGADILHFDSPGGRLTLDSTCVGGTVNMNGTFELIDNSSGMTLNRNGDAISKLAAVEAETNKIALADAGAGVTGSLAEEILNRPTTPMRGTDGVDTATMRGTDGANTTTPPTVTAIRTEMDDNSTKLLAIKAKTDTIPIPLEKNTAFANFPFVMVDSSDNPLTGLSVTVTRSIDGAAFGAAANSVVEVANGAYKINLAAGDLNGNSIIFRFVAATAKDLFITVIPNP